ncbi:MAG: transglutaminase domain-containing protein, partial [Fimbriimonadaceae bacterium]
VTGILAWMLALGSFAGWRDSTMAFQAVPGLALFGLVGAFNTFLAAPIVFFVFLAAWGVLFSRIQARRMLRQAIDAGYRDIDTIGHGPWRAKAGFEWPLLSAVIVGLASLVFTPFLRESTKNLAVPVRFTVPQSRPPAASVSLGASAPSDRMRIGNGPINPSERVVFEADAPGPSYFRTATFADYDDGEWRRSWTFDSEWMGQRMNFEPLRRQILNLPALRQIAFQVRLRQPMSGTFPVPGEFVRWQGVAPTSRVNPDGTLAVNSPPVDVVLGGIAASARPGSQSSVVDPDTSAILPNYLDTTTVPASVVQLALETAAGSQSPWEAAYRIQREIERRARYNLRAPAAPAGQDPVEYFLMGPRREGYCDLFASAMVLMARSVGIPARIAVGYYPAGMTRNDDGWWLLREADAHAWAELYFPDLGWVVFDPTAGADEVTGSGRGAAVDDTPWFRRPWFVAVLNALVVVGLGGALLFAISALRNPSRTPADDRREWARAYRRFSSTLERATGRPRRLSETPEEFFAAVRPELGALESEAARLTRTFVLAFYAPDEADPPSLTEVRAQVTAFEKLAKAQPKRRETVGS